MALIRFAKNKNVVKMFWLKQTAKYRSKMATSIIPNFVCSRFQLAAPGVAAYLLLSSAPYLLL
jgi:hypothetical protein